MNGLTKKKLLIVKNRGILILMIALSFSDVFSEEVVNKNQPSEQEKKLEEDISPVTPRTTVEALLVMRGSNINGGKSYEEEVGFLISNEFIDPVFLSQSMENCLLNKRYVDYAVLSKSIAPVFDLLAEEYLKVALKFEKNKYNNFMRLYGMVLVNYSNNYLRKSQLELIMKKINDVDNRNVKKVADIDALGTLKQNLKYVNVLDDNAPPNLLFDNFRDGDDKPLSEEDVSEINIIARKYLGVLIKAELLSDKCKLLKFNPSLSNTPPNQKK